MSKIAQPRDGEPIRLVQTRQGARYRVVLDVGTPTKRRQLTTTHATIGQARRYVTATRAALADGSFNAPRRDTVDHVLDAWLDLRRHEVRPVTWRGYRDSAQGWRRTLGQTPVQHLTRDEVQRVVTAMHSAGRSGNTIRAALVVLRAALALAVRDGVVPRNVAADVKPPRYVSPERRAWTPEQARAFLASIAWRPHETLFRLALLGLRRGEVLGLAWGAVDLDTPSLSVLASRVAVTARETQTDEPKSRRSRRVLPLSDLPDVVESLRGLRKRQREQSLAIGMPWRPDGLLALDATGEPLRPERYSDLWREACEAAGVPVLTLHEARHTAATLLAEAGTAPEVAAAWLGHDPALYLRTYVHPRTERVAAAGQALGRAFA